MALSLVHAPPPRGAYWVRDAFRVFWRRPMGFTGLFLAFLFVALVIQFVPLVGPLLQMMMVPLLSLGFMVATRGLPSGTPPSPVQFVEPLRGEPRRRQALLTLCVLYGALAALLLWTCDAIAGGKLAELQVALGSGKATRAEVDALMADPDVFLGTVFGLVAVAALSVPFWHAPALVHWGGQGAGQALFSSTLAVWRNKGAFVVYMLAWVGIVSAFGMVTALLLGGLGAPDLASIVAIAGGLVFSAVFYVSLWFTFSDSFGRGDSPTHFAELDTRA